MTRPSLPPVAWLAVGVWLGIAAGEALYATHLSSVAVLPAALCLCGLATTRACRAATLRVVAAGIVAGVALVSCALTSWVGQVARIDDADIREVSGVIDEDPIEGAWGWTFRLTDIGLSPGCAVDVVAPGPPPSRGARVAVSGSLVAADLDGEWARRAWRDDCVGRIRAWRVVEDPESGGAGALLRRFRSRVAEAIDRERGDGAALLRGLVLGDRRQLRSEVSVDFRAAGLSHLLAVSGLHLGIVALGVGRGLRALRFGRGVQLAGVIVAASLFALLTGVQTSTVRALVMVTVTGTGSLLGRRGSPTGALAVTVIGMLAFAPMSAFRVSFRLSVVAVLGLMVFARLVGEWLLPIVRSGRVATPLAASLVAQASTAPVVASVFHVVSVVAPLANIVAVPLATAALAMGLVGTAVCPVSAPLSQLAFGAAARVLETVVVLAEGAAGIPCAAICVPEPGAAGWGLWLFSGVGLWLRWPVPRRPRDALVGIGVTCALTWVVLGGGTHEGRLVVMDVGQADAILLQDGRQTMLVDAGGSASRLAAALGRCGVRSIDMVVLTHAHDDHTGGLTALVGTTPVGWVGQPLVADPEERPLSWMEVGRLTPRGRVRLVPLHAGMAWDVGATRVTVLWPDAEQVPRTTNDTSVVLLLERGAWSAVLGGDAETTAWEQMAQSAVLTDVDLLKAAHHGSENGMTERALADLAPESVVISVGEGNGFGHPDPAFLDLVEGTGARVLRTDLVGDIEVMTGAP